MRRLARLVHIVLPLAVVFALYLAGGGSHASAETVDFNACTGGIEASYTEDGLSFVPLAPGAHVHCTNAGGDGTVDLLNHPASTWHPYTITFSGGAFSLMQLDVVAANQTATFTNNLEGSVTIPASVGTFIFPSGWTDITSATWTQNGTATDDSQFLAIDNLVFVPAQVMVPEPATAFLTGLGVLGLLGAMGRRRVRLNGSVA